MRYYTALILLLSSLVASTSSSLAAAGEEDANAYVLPNAFMTYDILGRVNENEFDWRVKYVDLVAPRMGTCIATNEACSALGAPSYPRRRYFMSINEVSVPARKGKVTIDITLSSISIEGDSYNGTGRVTFDCNADECSSKNRFFLPIGEVPYTTYLNGKSVEP